MSVETRRRRCTYRIVSQLRKDLLVISWMRLQDRLGDKKAVIRFGASVNARLIEGLDGQNNGMNEEI